MFQFISAVLCAFVFMESAFSFSADALAPVTQIPRLSHTLSSSSSAKKTVEGLRLVEFVKERAFPDDLMKDMASLGGEWTQFTVWSKRLFRKVFLINALFALTSFCIVALFLLFILASKFPVWVLVCWLVALFFNVLFRVLFERYAQLLYEDLQGRLSELLAKEKQFYELFKVSSASKADFNANMVAMNLGFWKLSESYIFDFLGGLIGTILALAIFKPIIVVPFVLGMLILLAIIFYWALSPQTQKSGYDRERTGLSLRNRLLMSIGEDQAVLSSNAALNKEHERYLRLKMRVSFILRVLVMVALPAVGVALLFIIGTESLPLLFYVLSLQVVGIFQLQDFLTAWHRGRVARESMQSFLKEVTHDNPLLWNYALWQKERRKSRRNIRPKYVKRLSLDHLDLDIVDRQGAQPPVSIRDYSLFVERGEVIGLEGPSGCGKTTVLQILGGYMRAKGVYVNGYQYRVNGSLKVHSEQGTVVEVTPKNMSYHRLHWDKSSLVKYVSMDQVDDFKNISSLVEQFSDHGYDAHFLSRLLFCVQHLFPTHSIRTVQDLFALSDGNLSSGEKARIKLAVVLAANHSRFLMLDQPLSYLGEDHQLLVLRLLKKYALKYRVGIVIGQPDLILKEELDGLYTLNRKGRPASQISSFEGMLSEDDKMMQLDAQQQVKGVVAHAA